MAIMGYDFYGTHFFRSPGSAVKDIFYGELKNGVYDELEIREATDSTVSTTKEKEDWQIDTRAIFKFMGDLEGGNINNNGLKIVSFMIKRRKANELNSYTLATVPFQNNVKIEYTDYTQPNTDLIYSIVPLAENMLDGKAVEVQAKSDFVGWWVVDKDTNNVLGFDQAIDKIGEVETQLNQGRTVIETLSKYPSVFYSEKNYESFSLSTVLIPEDFSRSGLDYEEVLNNFIYNHKPFLVKSDDGRVFVCDISNPRATSPQNTWGDYDYKTIIFDFMEIGNYEDYVKGVI
ncbi:hypothetical protein [Paenibacillus sp. XY044]|uniref:hypothetical protein n=1 Tax=Paenibacillus sp. XY044 TaxID=2026089 RepID=UPI000B99ADBD|nr:hypothetical protein [Paenibacillus sp. XY044]OZB98010.1 hypothetical protein CJP46_02265 [Paenibacillus sp. XY044]